jgi:DNA-binding HxlR family transcriptional regulator
METIGDGEVLRAGVRPLVLLAATLNFLILSALRQRPLRLAELRQATGLPAQTTLRGHLSGLGALGVVAKRATGDVPYAVENELTPLGEELIAVGEALERWLAEAPAMPTSLRNGSAKGVIKAFVDGWGSGLLGALAEQPLSLTQLDRVIPALSYPALERRLSSMRMAGLVEAQPGGRNGTPYAVTAWARRGVVPLAAAGRCEQAHMGTLAAPLTTADVTAGFMLALPLASLPSGTAGRCRLEVAADAARVAGGGVEVTVADGRIVGCAVEPTSIPGEGASGAAEDWFEALVEDRAERLEYAGGKLPRLLVTGLREALVTAPAPAAADPAPA